MDVLQLLFNTENLAIVALSIMVGLLYKLLRDSNARLEKIAEKHYESLDKMMKAVNSLHDIMKIITQEKRGSGNDAVQERDE